MRKHFQERREYVLVGSGFGFLPHTVSKMLPHPKLTQKQIRSTGARL